MSSTRWIATGLLLPAFSLLAGDKKLTDDDRIEILRGIMAEYATVKTLLPRTKDPLPFQSDGTYDKQKWAEAGQKFGPAARVGDLVQITKVGFENDKILLEINGGTKVKGHWYDHVQVGMGNSTHPVSTQQNSNAPGGTNIAVLFNQPIPELKSADIKKMLASVLDFEKQSATQNLVETLPEPIQKAIAAAPTARAASARGWGRSLEPRSLPIAFCRAPVAELVSTASRAKLRSRADWKRSWGFFSRQRETIISSAGDTDGLISAIGGGCSLRIELITSIVVAPRKGRLPASIS